jgi:hypothetical protein
MLIHSAVITGSVQLNNTDVSSITNVAGFATTASVGALVVKTGSYASTSSVNNLQSVTGSYATTGSNQFNGNQSISGSIISNGTITAQTLVVQTVTSSIEFVTGSTKNGSLAANTHQFTGSMSVSGSITSTGNNYLRAGGSGNDTAGNGPNIGVWDSVNTNNYWIWQLNGSNGLNLFQYNSGWNTRLTVSSSGNVGIGTTSPSVKLDVSDATNAIIRVNATSDGAQAALSLNGYASGGVYRASRLNFQQAGTNKWAIIQDYNQNNTNSLTFEQAGSAKITFDANGSVGIGNTSPSTKLHVTGTVSSNDLLLAGTVDYSYTTSDSWTSYQTIIPTGALVAQAVYMVRLIYSTDNGPWVVTTSFLFSPANTNGASADGQFAPMISTHQGGTGIIYVRARAAFSSIAGLEAVFSGFTKNIGNLSVRVVRLM